MGSQPTVAPALTEIDDHWRQFDNSVNAVSFGFVATAVLISMFLVMAIFERFLRPPPTSPDSSPSGRRYVGDVESQMGFHGKLRFPSPKVTIGAVGSCIDDSDLILAMTNYELFIAEMKSEPSDTRSDSSDRCTIPLHKVPQFLDMSSSNAREVSVLMPGEDIPTFIANPAPIPCPPERIAWPAHQSKTNTSSSST